MAHALARRLVADRAVRFGARFGAAVLLAALMGAAFGLPHADAADGPPLTVVMDGSGSMWGKIGTERLAKFQLARQGLAEGLPKLPPNTPLGLVAFGHRRTGCQDVEVLRVPEAGNATRVVDLLGDFNPRGRGPVTAGLQSALETIPKGSAGAILLIHDDLDNCQQNPCSLTDGLRAQHPGVVIHVVSIAMSPADARQMQCLTTTTGGQHYLATSGAQVVSAIAEVIEIVARSPGAPAQTARPETGPRDSPAASGPGLHLVASLGPTALAPDLPVRWRAERMGGGDGAALQRQQGGAVTLPLVPGRYAITAELDLLSVRQEIEVADVASMRVQLALAGGTLRLAAIAGRMNKPLDGTRFVIRPAGAAGSDDKPVAPSWIARGSRVEVALPEGRYEVVVTHGSTRVVQEAAVVAGERRAIDVRLAVGELELATLQRENGSKLEQVAYVIQEDDPDAPQGRREVARSAAAQPVFALPAGTYHVIASHGAAEVRDRVAVGAGEVVRRDLVLNSAELSLASGLVARLATDPDEVQWRIVPIERRDGKVVRAYGPATKVVLGAGRYRVEARFGPLNAQASREIAIAAGAQDTVSLTPAAARVRLRLAPVQGEPAGDVFWKVRLESGAIVWSSTESEPVGLLQQGTYVIEVQTRQTRHERVAEIRAGADRLVVMGEN
jgi:Ca-activated chloride channel family protein